LSAVQSTLALANRHANRDARAKSFSGTMTTMHYTSIAIFVTILLASSAKATTYFVDCASGSDLAPGRAEATAWKTIERVSLTSFKPGDSILFRRGTHCSGSLWPKGSGLESHPIRIGAYGKGALPVIEAGGAEAAIKLLDQQQWEIENLETTGGSPYGVYVGASGSRTLHHFRIRNLVVHDVSGNPKTKTTGLIVCSAGNGATLADVVIDGVTAYRTTEWAGIIVFGGRDVIVRNSLVHDVYGDGIVLFQTENGLIEKSAAWLTGLQPKETIGTPNGIWTWNCRNCIVQATEGFWTDSPGFDGGIYDIDFANHDNTVQYNYGHDAQGYCLAVFGAENQVTTNSTVRYNVCINNGRSPKLARRQGEVFISTWDNGSLDGVLIYNNTLFWNPSVDAPPIKMTEGTTFSGSGPDIFFNNIIISNVPSMAESESGMSYRRNLYWYPGDALPKWSIAGHEHLGFAAYHETAADELFGDPKLDWLLRPVPGSPAIGHGLSIPGFAAGAVNSMQTLGKASDIGAVEALPVPESAGNVPTSLPRAKGKWMLLLFASKAAPEARSQLVFVQTAIAQYGGKSLEAAVLGDANTDLQYDWNLGTVKFIEADGLGQAMAIQKVPSVLLISPSREIVGRWDRFAPPAELGLTLKHYLGPANGDPILDLNGGEQ